VRTTEAVRDAAAAVLAVELLILAGLLRWEPMTAFDHTAVESFTDDIAAKIAVPAGAGSTQRTSAPSKTTGAHPRGSGEHVKPCTEC